MMYQNRILTACDPKQPYLPKFSGTFELSVPVGEKNRRMLAYAPEDIRESTAGILVLGENGKTADELLKSGWCEIADTEECKEKLIVFFLEPEDGVWHTDEPYGKPDGDVAYIHAASLLAEDRKLFCVHESKLYLVGCGAGGTLAHMAAAYDPAYFAGVVSVGAPGVSESYLNDCGADFALNLDGYEDPAHRKGIRKKDIPMPAWVIDDPESTAESGQAMVNYWRQANETEETPRQLAPDCIEYFRTKETPYALNQEKEAYRVCFSRIPGAAKDDARRLQRRIWKDFLYRQRRWMSSPGGELRVTRDPVRDLGMEYHYEEFDGWMREWYVYIPQSVKNQPEKKVPLVLAMHGYTCTGEIYAGNSAWYDVAEKYGFIVVFPSALHAKVNMPEQGLMPDWAPLNAWNVFLEDDRPDELKFFHGLLDRMLQNYPVDEKRVFATGHSWGSLMTEMLALGMTKRLAAIAPCSGAFFGGAYERMIALPYAKENGVQLPVWMFWGTEEEWPPGVSSCRRMKTRPEKPSSCG